MKKINNRAFTLIDLIVSVAIVSIISSLIVANIHSYNQNSKLELETRKLISNIRSLQNNTLNSKEFNSQKPDGGWGIFIHENDNKYFLFCDCNQNGQYDIAEKLKEVELPANLVFDNLEFSNAIPTTVNKDYLQILFIPPMPTTNIVGFDDLFYSNPTADSVVGAISIKDTGTNTSKTIFINKYGLIDTN